MVAAFTEMIYSEKRSRLNECEHELNIEQKNINTESVKLAHNTDPYDQLLLNDSYYLKFIRKYEKKLGFTTPLVWSNVFYIAMLYFLTAYLSLSILIFGNIPTKWQTILYFYMTVQIAGFGVTGGVHRYWSHRSYKAKLPLQIILAICYSMAGQNTIYEWVRDHRLHHKFSDTSADPHNPTRGFFFSHAGWLMMKKHPDVIREGNKIDMRDIINDPVVKLHTKYFTLLKIIFCWVAPCLPPILLWNEHWSIVVITQCFLRFFIILNSTWAVNSFAHLWGTKPYNRNIMPSENPSVAIFSMGEGFHNYHHMFPWDYRTSELGTYLNTTTLILNFFARISWAYDLKSASPDLVKTVVKNKGGYVK